MSASVFDESYPPSLWEETPTPLRRRAAPPSPPDDGGPPTEQGDPEEPNK